MLESGGKQLRFKWEVGVSEIFKDMLWTFTGEPRVREKETGHLAAQGTAE